MCRLTTSEGVVCYEVYKAFVPICVVFIVYRVPCLCMSCKVTRGVVMYETGRCTRVKVGTKIFIQPPVLFTSPIATNIVSGASRAHFLHTDVGNIRPSRAKHSNHNRN